MKAVWAEEVKLWGRKWNYVVFLCICCPPVRTKALCLHADHPLHSYIYLSILTFIWTDLVTMISRWNLQRIFIRYYCHQRSRSQQAVKVAMASRWHWGIKVHPLFTTVLCALWQDGKMTVLFQVVDKFLAVWPVVFRCAGLILVACTNWSWNLSRALCGQFVTRSCLLDSVVDHHAVICSMVHRDAQKLWLLRLWLLSPT